MHLQSIMWRTLRAEDTFGNGAAADVAASRPTDRRATRIARAPRAGPAMAGGPSGADDLHGDAFGGTVLPDELDGGRTTADYVDARFEFDAPKHYGDMLAMMMVTMADSAHGSAQLRAGEPLFRRPHLARRAGRRTGSASWTTPTGSIASIRCTSRRRRRARQPRPPGHRRARLRRARLGPAPS